MIKPFPHQEKAIRELYADARTHIGNPDYAPLMVWPTGSGKSVAIAMILRDLIAKDASKRALVLCHVRELIAQNYQRFMQVYPEADAGIYSAGLNRRDTQHSILFAGIQSMYDKAHIVGRFDVVIVDEAHMIPRSGNGRYRTFFSDHKRLYGKCRIIGLTATPMRLDSGLLTEGDDAIFTNIACEISIAHLIAQGYLARLTTKSGHVAANLENVHTRQGDYITSELDNAMREDGLTRRIIQDALPRMVDRYCIMAFGVTVDHAHEISDTLNDNGIPCAVVSGKTPTDERDRLIAKFRAGELRALSNVSCLTTGFDIPQIDCLLLMRPTQSTALHIQMIGRALRVAEGKTDALILDYAGNTQRHGCIDDPNINIPKKGKGDGEAPTKTCPECESVLHARISECPDCGHLFPPPAPKLELVASDAPILKADIKPVTVAVSNVTYRKHQKEGKLPTLQVDYWDETGIYPIKIASEWVCVEHELGSFPRLKAQRWLKQHGLVPFHGQSTLDGYLAAQHIIKKPAAIVIDKSSKYPQVIDYIFEDESAIYQAA